MSYERTVKLPRGTDWRSADQIAAFERALAAQVERDRLRDWNAANAPPPRLPSNMITFTPAHKTFAELIESMNGGAP